MYPDLSKRKDCEADAQTNLSPSKRVFPSFQGSSSNLSQAEEKGAHNDRLFNKGGNCILQFPPKIVDWP